MATRRTLEILIRQAARWSTAATQDEHPFIAVLHANYGVAYALALRQLASDQEIVAKTGVNPWELEHQVIAIQDDAALELSRKCPELSKRLGPLAVLAKEAVMIGD